jgi:hypothetical protein
MEAEAARDEKQRRGAGGGAGGEGGSTRPPRALEQVKANRVSNVELDRPGAALKLSDTTTAAKAEPSSSHLAPPHRGRRPGEAGARRYVEREKRRATWRAVALLGVALPLLHGAESVAMRCYQGVSYSRCADADCADASYSLQTPLGTRFLPCPAQVLVLPTTPARR